MREIGYIKLHRKLVKWRWYTNQVMKSVFLHLLLMANFTKNYYNGVEVRPGQTVTGRRALAEATGLTENQVRGAMTKLKETGEITVKSMGHFSVVTVVNWAKYQAETPVEVLVEVPVEVLVLVEVVSLSPQELTSATTIVRLSRAARMRFFI